MEIPFFQEIPWQNRASFEGASTTRVSSEIARKREKRDTVLYWEADTAGSPERDIKMARLVRVSWTRIDPGFQG